MELLPETSTAIYQLRTQFEAKGTHAVAEISLDPSGLPLTSEDFDPNRHSVEQIDPLSLLVVGRPQVRVTLPAGELTTSVVVDFSSMAKFRGQASSANSLKGQAMLNLGRDIDSSARSLVGDHAHRFILGGRDMRRHMSESDFIEIDGPTNFYTAIDRLMALGSVGILMSDFSNINPEELPRGLIAVKVNHPLERRLHANCGRIYYGQTREVDTRNPRQVREANHSLAVEHRRIMSGLRASGSFVASVICDYRYESGYNPKVADWRIASALGKKRKTS